jgi:dUTP pyrophosphatase
MDAETQTIQPGDRIAQLVIQKVESISWVPTDALEDTQRSIGGFGSTGIK